MITTKPVREASDQGTTDDIKVEFGCDQSTQLNGTVPVSKASAPRVSQSCCLPFVPFSFRFLAIRSQDSIRPNHVDEPFDIVLIAFNQALPAHRSKLARSPYFRAMLEGHWRESSSSTVELIIDDPNISFEAISVALDHLYGREIQLSPYLPFQLLAASSMLQLDELAAKCVSCIAETLGPHTLIDAAEFALHYCQPSLLNHCLRWLKWHLAHGGSAKTRKKLTWISRPESSACPGDFRDEGVPPRLGSSWLRRSYEQAQPPLKARRACSHCDLVLDGESIMYHNRKLPIDVFKELITAEDVRRERSERPEASTELVQCYIKRVKDSNNVNMRTYYLYSQSTHELLLVGRKRKTSATSEFVASIDANDLSRHGGSYVGSVRSNFLGTQYVVYDKGFNPEEIDPSLFPLPEREELAIVHYQVNLLGVRGPRKMTVLVPRVHQEKGRIRFHSNGLLRHHRSKAGSDLMTLHNKPPLWSDQLNAYTLNFYGRVKMASKKNFQLISSENSEHILLMFGKVDADTFTLDYRHPFSCVQAFSIALTSFDRKVAVS
mmetsp:Transcript_973/g.1495  ORF Transcript_973/g.1495 Transcript_973/m.1495 type:complete len:549 (+) Transcript_973:134-1780(+)